MATPVATVPEYCAAISRSQLVSEAELRGVREKWLAAPNSSDADVDGFRAFLVREKVLTEYQAAVIRRGRSGGFVIGEYVILDRVGSGQTAGVYKAIHKSGQLVALKVLAGSKAKDQHTLNRFQREGRLLTQLEHPNAVRAYQVGQAGDVHYIVMEYLEGETLDAVLDRRKKLPAPEAVRIVWQAFQGLHHLHSKRMVHRDLKPANLMLVPAAKTDTLNSTVKILDIGIGREMFDESSPSTQDLHLTTEGALLGTPDYLAPEQARDARSSDIRADIYSLGCVLYQLLTGRPPFLEKNVMQQMVRHATEVPKPVRELVPDVPTELSGVVERLLKKKPSDRPPTPSDAAELLKPFLPAKAKQAENAPLVPAYRQWLESESAFELPKEVKAAGRTRASGVAAKAGDATRPVADAPPAVKTAPATRPVVLPARQAPGVAVLPMRPEPVPAPVPTVNVELVEMSDLDGDDRGMLDMDRRDWLMLGAGGFLMLAAIAGGYALTKLSRGKLDEAKD